MAVCGGRRQEDHSTLQAGDCMAESLKTDGSEDRRLKKRIIAAVAVFGLLGGILYFAYAQTCLLYTSQHSTDRNLSV